MNENNKQALSTDIDKARQKKRLQIRAERRKKFLGIVMAGVVTIVVWQVLQPQYFLYAARTYIESMLSSASFPVRIAGNTILKQERMNEKTIVLSNSEVLILNQKGYPQMEEQHYLKNPKLSVNGDFFLAIDQGNQDLILGTQYEMQPVIQLQNKIRNAAVSSNGMYAVVVDSEKYLNEVIVYDSQNNEIYRWLSASEYVVNAYFHPNNKRMVIQAIDAVGGSLNTFLYYIDLSQSQEISKITRLNEYPLEILLYQDFIRIVGESKISDINYQGAELRAFDYHNQKIVDFSVQGTNLAVALSSADNSYYNTVKILDTKLNIYSEFTIDDVISDIDFQTKTVAFLSPNQLRVYDGKGNMIQQKPLESSNQKVMLLNDKVLTFTKEQILHQTFNNEE